MERSPNSDVVDMVDMVDMVVVEILGVMYCYVDPSLSKVAMCGCHFFSRRVPNLSRFGSSI